MVIDAFDFYLSIFDGVPHPKDIIGRGLRYGAHGSGKVKILDGEYKRQPVHFGNCPIRRFLFEFSAQRAAQLHRNKVFHSRCSLIAHHIQFPDTLSFLPEYRVIETPDC
jgi:hypothetical protein